MKNVFKKTALLLAIGSCITLAPKTLAANRNVNTNPNNFNSSQTNPVNIPRSLRNLISNPTSNPKREIFNFLSSLNNKQEKINAFWAISDEIYNYVVSNNPCWLILIQDYINIKRAFSRSNQFEIFLISDGGFVLSDRSSDQLMYALFTTLPKSTVWAEINSPNATII